MFSVLKIIFNFNYGSNDIDPVLPVYTLYTIIVSLSGIQWHFQLHWPEQWKSPLKNVSIRITKHSNIHNESMWAY